MIYTGKGSERQLEHRESGRFLLADGRRLTTE